MHIDYPCVSNTRQPYAGLSSCLRWWLAWSWRLQFCHIFPPIFLFREPLPRMTFFGVDTRIFTRDVPLTHMSMNYNKTVASWLEQSSISAGSMQWLCWASRLKSYLDHTLLMEIRLKCQVQGRLATAPKINLISSLLHNVPQTEESSSGTIILGSHLVRECRMIGVHR